MRKQTDISKLRRDFKKGNTYLQKRSLRLLETKPKIRWYLK